MIAKHHNQNYTTIEGNNVPARTGDRRWAQDRVRDFRFHQDRIGLIMKDLFGAMPILLSGGVVTQGSGLNLNITEGFGYAEHNVSIPDSFASLPPSVTTADLEGIRVAWAAQTNINGSSGNCSEYNPTEDGSTVNYVKMRYKEVNGNTRNKAKYSGSYAYEVVPDFDLQVNAVAPTNYDILLATFTSNGTTYTITIIPAANAKSQMLGNAINVAIAKATPVDADMIGLMDSAVSNILKKLSWANIKATLKTYFDTLYVALTGAQTIAGTKTFSDTIVPSKGIKPTGSLHAASYTENEIFDALAPSIPNVNDEIKINGGYSFYTANIGYHRIFSKAKRTSSTVITLDFNYMSVNPTTPTIYVGVSNVTVTDGSSSTISNLSLSW